MMIENSKQREGYPGPGLAASTRRPPLAGMHTGWGFQARALALAANVAIRLLMARKGWEEANERLEL